MALDRNEVITEFQNPAGPPRDIMRIAAGQLTLVAGAASLAIPGFTNPKISATYFTIGGATGTLRASYTAGNVIVTSSSGTDVSVVHVILVE